MICINFRGKNASEIAKKHFDIKFTVTFLPNLCEIYEVQQRNLNSKNILLTFQYTRKI